MTDNWFVARNEKKKGPFSMVQLRQLAAGAKLRPTDMLLPAGTEKWMPASQVAGLFDAVVAAPPQTLAQHLHIADTNLQKPTKDNPARQIADKEYPVAIPVSGPPPSPSGPATDRWWYMSDGTAKSVSFDALKNLAKNGKLEPSCMVHQDGMNNWLPASKFTALWADPPPIPAAPIFVPPPVPTGVPAPLQSISAPPVAVPPPLPVLIAAPASISRITSAVPLPREEIREVVAVGPSSPPGPPLAELKATYRGGHPDFPERASGILKLDALGLEFVPGEGSTNSINIPYEKIGSILEPQKGEFPEEMIKKSESTKATANLIGLGAGLFGKTLGRVPTQMPGGQLAAGLVGATLANVGKSVAGGVRGSAALGPPPTNRIRVIMLDGGVKHKVLFDVDGQSKEELEKLAQAFWSNSAKVRSRFGKPAAQATGLETTPVSALNQLTELMDVGVLTQAEFDQQKAALLGQQPQLDATVELKPKIVGCPKCQAKLRAKKPGIIQCPRCQSKMRVDQSRFQ